MAWVALFALIAAAPAAASNLLIQSGGDPDGSTSFVDSSADGTTHYISAFNAARHETDLAKFGTSSIYIDREDEDYTAEGYLKVYNSSDFDFGLGDFTVDFWVRMDRSFTNWNYALSTIPNGNFLIAIDNNTSGQMVPRIRVVYVDGSDTFTSKSNGIIPDANHWHHIALTRSNKVFRYFLDGVLQQTWSNEMALMTPTNGMGVGALSDGGSGGGYQSDFRGYLEEIRVIKGAAVWTSNFSPPAGPYSEGGFDIPQGPSGPFDGNANLLIQSGGHADLDTNFTDTSSSGSLHTIVPYVAAHHETDESKYGNSSISIDNYYGDYLKVSNSGDLNFGTGDFTIDVWFNTVRNDANWNYILSTIPYGNIAIAIDNNGGGTHKKVPRIIVVYDDDTQDVTLSSNSLIDANEWHHIMLTRSNKRFRYFLNGVLEEDWYSEKALKTPTNGMGIGARSDGSNGGGVHTWFRGYVEEVRVIKGVAARTSTFQSHRRPYGLQEQGIFGVDAGAKSGVNHSFLQKAMNNNFTYVKYFMNESKLDNRAYLANAQSVGSKVMVVLAPGTAWIFPPTFPTGEAYKEESYWLNEYDANMDDLLQKEEYAEAVYDRLNNVRDYINNGTVFGVELGNEEDLKWFTNTPTQLSDPHYMVGSINPEATRIHPVHQYWSGDFDDGIAYADYYLEAFKRLKNDPDFDDLYVAGGSLYYHENVSWGPDVTGNFGSSGEFLRGFLWSAKIQAVVEDLDDPFYFMPDAISLHSYIVTHPPEWHIWSDTGSNRHGTSYFNRLAEIKAIANEYNANPGFIDTEHGNGYTLDATEKKFAPLAKASAPSSDAFDPNTYTQAIYYLRSVLIKANSQSFNHPWEMSFYWQHPYSYDQTTAFFGDYDGTILRPVHGIAQILHSISSIGVGRSGTEILIPNSWTDPGSNLEGLAMCGWKHGFDYWIAVWFYKNRFDDSGGYQWYYYPPDGPEDGFEVSIDLTGNYTVLDARRFDFGSNPAANPQYPSFNTQVNAYPSRSYWNGTTSITVRNVRENPTFIKLNKQ